MSHNPEPFPDRIEVLDVNEALSRFEGRYKIYKTWRSVVSQLFLGGVWLWFGWRGATEAWYLLFAPNRPDDVLYLVNIIVLFLSVIAMLFSVIYISKLLFRRVLIVGAHGLSFNGGRQYDARDIISVRRICNEGHFANNNLEFSVRWPAGVLGGKFLPRRTRFLVSIS
jgi:hypothetical protein